MLHIVMCRVNNFMIKQQKNTEKKTKIVATIGPATEGEAVMTKMFEAGLNVVRLNFSHGDHAEHGARVETARALSKKLNIPVAILQDLAGPKIRIGDLETERVTLVEGSTFTLTTEKILGTASRAHVNYEKLPQEVKKGGYIMLDDGKKKLQIVKTTETEVVCKVLVGGEIKPRRGVNVPGAYLSISSLTTKDKKDLAFGIEQGVDFVGLSFVRQPNDVISLRKLLQKAGSKAGIISKVETQEAIDNIDEIIRLSDGIMVARGDLAIEVPATDVPLLQKMIIRKCNLAGKPVITATQMLESMIKSPVPTRAEVSDIANAIFDGTDAVMLSEESTLGMYPVEAVNIMTEVAQKVEASREHLNLELDINSREVVDVVGDAVVTSAEALKAVAIVALTESGKTAQMISRFKPRQPIVVATPNGITYNKMALSYGCKPILIDSFKSIDDARDRLSELLLQGSFAKKGEKVVVCAGIPFGQPGSTNILHAMVV